ncbi:hypothetical protein KR059_005629 [Drosophila kikkawai]|nr:hypothetical protein KR059_005629 [Drosophila kikkawai]
MSLRKSFLGCLLVATALIMLHHVHADADTNELDSPDTYMLQGVKVYPHDRQCVMVGGLCVKSEDCLEPTTKRGLCPSSAAYGVECCYELPVRPAPCQQHGGVCMSFCNKRLLRPGNDCKNGQACCLLLV